MRAVLIDSQGRVQNLIEIDPDGNFEPAEGYRVVVLDPNDAVNIGDIFDGGVWVPTPVEPPVEPEPETPGPTLEEQVAELRATVEMLLLSSLEG